jgi:hypothetical protein
MWGDNIKVDVKEIGVIICTFKWLRIGTSGELYLTL